MKRDSFATPLKATSRLAAGAIAALAAFLGPRAGVEPAADPSAQRGEEAGATRFRVPQLVGAAQASMHVSTIANLTTVLRFKAAIMTKSTAEISSFIHKLHHEAAAARKSNDVNRIVISTKRLMVMTDALRERIEGMEKARR
jgi:hypothetical protein